MSDPEHILDWLQGWYVAQCNDDWEHEWGVKIETLDNPGWRVRIDLEDTDLEGYEYPRHEVSRSTHDWVRVWTSDKVFHATCGPAKLAEALTLFRSWTAANTAPTPLFEAH